MIEFVIIAIGITILLGFLGNVLFERTSIPNTLWLLFFGISLGAIGFVTKEFILGASGLIGAIAIIGILSDGGLHLEIKKILSEGFLGFFLMAFGIIFSTVSAVIVLSFFGYSFEAAILVGVIIAGTSSSVIIPIITSLKGVSEKLRTILSLESVFDTFSIVIALILIEAIANKHVLDIGSSFVQGTALSFFSAIGIGLLFGLFWSPWVARFKKYEFSYTATLGSLILLYAFTELIGSSGPIAVFFAGIMLANSHLVFSSIFRGKKFEKMDQDISKTHSLFAFLIRVFFFVFLGIIVGIPDVKFMLIGFSIVSFILVSRFFYLNIFSYLGVVKFSQKEKRLFYVMVPRGLSAAVLGVVALSSGLSFGEDLIKIIFSVIMFSIIFTTVGVFLMQKKSEAATDSRVEEIRLPTEFD